MQTSPVTPCQEPCLSTNDPSQPPLPQNAQPLYACCQKSRACIVIRHKSLFVCKRSLTQEPYELYPRPLATATQRPPTLCALSKEPYLHAKESKEPSLPACAPSPPPLPQPHNARLCYVCCQKGPIYTQKSPVERALFTHLRPLATATATQRPPTLCVLWKWALFTRKRIERVLSQEPFSPTCALSPLPLPHKASLPYVCCQKVSFRKCMPLVSQNGYVRHTCQQQATQNF